MWCVSLEERKVSKGGVVTEEHFALIEHSGQGVSDSAHAAGDQMWDCSFLG